MKKTLNVNKLFSFAPILLSLSLLITGIEFSIGILLIASLLTYLIMADRNPTVKNILIVSFLVRVVVAFIDHYGYLTHYGWDEFFSTSVQIKANLLTGYPLLANVTGSIHGVSYGIFCAFVYLLFGDYQIVMRIVNCFLGVLVADRVYRISLRLTGDEKASLLATGITAFYPSFIIYCALDMRDAMIFFLTAEMLYRISLLLAQKSGKNLLLLAFEVIALYFLRTQYLILFSMIVFIYLIIRSNLYQKKMQRLAFVILLLLVAWVGYRYLQQRNFFSVLLKFMNADLAWRAAGGSAYLVGVQYETWLDIFRWTPIRIVHFAFGPFFWSVTNLFMLMGAVESFALVFITIAAFSRIARNLYFRNPPLYLVLLLFAVIGLLSSAVIDSNYGTALRHKMNFIFIFFIFSAEFIKTLHIKII